MPKPCPPCFVASAVFLMAMSPLAAQDYASMKLEKVKAAVGRLNNSAAASSFVDQALASGRADLSKLAFEHPMTASFLWDRVRAMPDSPQRREHLLMMLRSDSTAGWPDGGGSFQRTTQWGTVETLRPLLQPYLPGMPMDWDSIRNHDLRVKLAAAYEQALARTRPPADTVPHKSGGAGTDAVPQPVE